MRNVPPRVSSLKTIWKPALVESPYVMIIMQGSGNSPTPDYTPDYTPDSAEGASDIPDLTTGLDLPRMNYLLLGEPMEDCREENDPAGEHASSRGVEQTHEALEEAVGELEGRGFERRNIFWLGYAEGCRMTLELGVRAIHDYGGFIGISGCRFDPRALVRRMTPQARSADWLICHGSLDDQIPAEHIRRGIKSLAVHGLPVVYCEFVKGHDIDFETELPMIRQWIIRRI